MRIKFSYWLSFFISYFLLGDCVFAQKEASVFFLNKGYMVDFKTGNPLVSNIGPLFAPYTGIASICNKEGELLFYTNGTTIYDSRHHAIPNGTGLTWTVALSNLLIIPAGVSEKKYYLVTADNFHLTYDTGSDVTGNKCCYINDTTTSYSIINVDSDKKVSLVQKNIPLLKPGSNLIAATKHKNGIDTWLVTMEFKTRKFYAYLFTECGVSQPVISEVNVNIWTPQYLAFSPNGTKLVATLFDNYLMDFDNSNGSISNPLNLGHYLLKNSLAFSPGSNYLYAAYNDSDGNNHLSQYDIHNKTIDYITIPSSSALDSGIGSSMTPAIDGKIYFNGGGWESVLSAYENPDEPLNKVNLKYNLGVINKQPLSILQIFPNFISNYFDPNYSSQQTDIGKPIIKQPPRICEGDTVRFQVEKTKAISEFFWSFGDGENIYNVIEPKHCYKNSGTYKAKLVVKYNCEYDTLYTTIIVDAKRVPIIEDTIFSCQKVELKAEDGYTFYQWNTGENSSTIQVSISDIYTVKLTNTCGVFENIYNIVKPETQTYNLLTTNKDEKNDYLFFKEYPLSSTVEIYNRWGVKVFISTDYKNNWPIETIEDGLYYYKFSYSGCQVIKGWIQVVR